MKFKKQQLRIFDIYCTCDECDEILVENDKIMQKGKFVYTCPKCGKNYYVDTKYPQRVYEKMGTPIQIK